MSKLRSALKFIALVWFSAALAFSALLVGLASEMRLGNAVMNLVVIMAVLLVAIVLFCKPKAKDRH